MTLAAVLAMVLDNDCSEMLHACTCLSRSYLDMHINGEVRAQLRKANKSANRDVRKAVEQWHKSLITRFPKAIIKPLVQQYIIYADV